MTYIIINYILNFNIHWKPLHISRIAHQSIKHLDTSSFSLHCASWTNQDVWFHSLQMAPPFLEQLDCPSLPWTRATRMLHSTPEILAVRYTKALLIPYFRLYICKRCPNLVLVLRADIETCFRRCTWRKIICHYTMMMGHWACKGQGSL